MSLKSKPYLKNMKKIVRYKDCAQIPCTPAIMQTTFWLYMNHLKFQTLEKRK